MRAGTEGVDEINLLDPNGQPISPLTEESFDESLALSGTAANGQTVCTLADTWYAIPSGTLPTENYELVFVGETVGGTLRIGFNNSSTPSTTNGIIWGGGMMAVTLGQSTAIYVSSDNAGDTVNWTIKRIT